MREVKLRPTHTVPTLLLRQDCVFSLALTRQCFLCEVHDLSGGCSGWSVGQHHWQSLLLRVEELLLLLYTVVMNVLVIEFCPLFCVGVKVGLSH